MNRTLTLIIHGTYAAKAGWWRLGSKGETTFADRLETELAHRGLSGTVWKPAIDNGLNYESFAWSGKNRHRDRIRGAKKLSSSLKQFAQQMGATSDEPLTVNFVAHSHGGNVVLEALRYLKSNIRLGRIALLGTPLITVKPAFRLVRFIFSIYLFVAYSVIATLIIIILVNYLFKGQLIDTRQFGNFTELVLYFPMLILTGWMWWAFGKFLDFIWTEFLRLFQPLLWIRGKSESQVYGPSPKKLAKILSGRQIFLLTSHNDEADLLLQISSTPEKFYKEYVQEYFSKIKRSLEYILLRPLFLSVLLKVIETVLDSFSLGFSLWRTLLFDYKVAPFRERPYYPSHLLYEEEIKLNPTTRSVMLNSNADVTKQMGTSQNNIIERRELLTSLKDVINEIKRQVQLRHSTYYEDKLVIQRLADILTGNEVKAIDQSKPSKSLKPPEKFWEILLGANLSITALYSLIIGSLTEESYVVLIGGYVFPLFIWGIILVLYKGIKRRWPLKSWRWFWVLWAIWAISTFLDALNTRLNP